LNPVKEMKAVEHEQIREWLHRKREELSQSELETLEGHLEACNACRSYALQLQTLEGELQNAFHARWDHAPIPALDRGLPAGKRIKAAPALAVTFLAVVLILAFLLRSPLAEIFSAEDITQIPESTSVSQVRATGIGQPTEIVLQPTHAEEDEHLIAFVSLRDGNREIYVMPVQGENPINLTRNPAQDYAPIWSPDGERIAFISDRNGQPELFVMQMDGTRVTRLREVPGAKVYGEPSWSPDGQQLAVQLILEYPFTAQPYSQIYLLAADGSGAFALTQTEFPLSDLEPKWSPVGDRIASRTLGIVQAFSGGITQGEPEQVRLSRGLAKVGTLEWSPDGSHLVYFVSCQYCMDDQDLTPTLHLIEAEGDNPQVLVSFEDQDLYGVGLSWSPDGRQLLLLASEVHSGTQFLYLISVDDSHMRRLADLPADRMESVPDWSPDGSQLMVALRENGESGIYILDLHARLSSGADGGLTRLSASRVGDSSPRWQP
jgi:dipeptidyl aminopeptidase/acylaminoacyl peptidase